MASDDHYGPRTEPFGRWLTQKDRGNWIGGVALTARRDRTFSKDGDPEAAGAHLRSQQADRNVFRAVDDAESEWSSL